MPEPEKPTNNNTKVALEQPSRELTQTDHINKKLLTSLFERMNKEDESPQPDENTTKDEEWED